MMASSSSSTSYLERKLRKLNCIKGQQFYGSLDSLNTIDTYSYSSPFANRSENREQSFKLFDRINKKKYARSNNAEHMFTVSYEQMIEHEDDEDDANERKALLEHDKIYNKIKKYSNIGCDDVADDCNKDCNYNRNKKNKKNVTFIDFFTKNMSKEEKKVEKCCKHEEKNNMKKRKKIKNKKNKKGMSNLLKRTGKLIVRTCRLISYGTPYGTHLAADFPYNTRYPPDYRYYDFETKQYDFGYSNNYVGINGYSPSVFF